MRHVIVSLVLLVATTASIGLAEADHRERLLKKETTTGPKAGQIQLYSIDDDKAVTVQKKTLLPNRVYLLPAPNGKGYLYALTNFEGKFAKPMEYLRAESILASALLGSKHLYRRYQLTNDGKWVRARDIEVHYLYVDDNPPYYKTIAYRQPPG